MKIDQVLSHMIMELIGSMILAFGVIKFHVDMTLSTILLPFIAAAAVCSCYRVTGGLLNPALTIVNLLRRDKADGFSYVLAILYIIAQYAGCLIGAFFLWWFTRGTGSMNLAKNPLDMAEAEYSEAIGFETFASAVLAIVYLSQTGKETAITVDSGIQGIFIGFSYAALIALTQGITGGNLNPAIGFAQNIVHWIDTESEYSIQYLWIYTAFPIIGALIGYAIHQLIMVKGSKDFARKSDGDDDKVVNQA